MSEASHSMISSSICVRSCAFTRLTRIASFSSAPILWLTTTSSRTAISFSFNALMAASSCVLSPYLVGTEPFGQTRLSQTDHSCRNPRNSHRMRLYTPGKPDHVNANIVETRSAFAPVQARAYRHRGNTNERSVTGWGSSYSVLQSATLEVWMRF